MNPKFCFVAGTLVMTKQGSKAIEEIQVGSKLIVVHNDCTPSNSKNYSLDEIAQKYNISVNDYHKIIKPRIFSKVKPNYIVGKNPNIMLNKVGDIGYQGAKEIGFQDTGLNIIEIIKEVGL